MLMIFYFFLPKFIDVWSWDFTIVTRICCFGLESWPFDCIPFFLVHVLCNSRKKKTLFSIYEDTIFCITSDIAFTTGKWLIKLSLKYSWAVGPRDAQESMNHHPWILHAFFSSTLPLIWVFFIQYKQHYPNPNWTQENMDMGSTCALTINNQ
jgi:hypothetical protein